jgi:hypothetical protein
MYDEVCQQPGVGVDGVGRPFLSPLVYIRPMDDWLFMGPNRWEMYQHRHTRPQAAALLFGGTGYCHGVENIPVEASGSTQVDSFFLFYIRPCLSFSPSPFGISLPQTSPCIISYFMYSTIITLMKSKKVLEKSERQKDQASSRNPNFHVPARCAVCTGSRPPKG